MIKPKAAIFEKSLKCLFPEVALYLNEERTGLSAELMPAYSSSEAWWNGEDCDHVFPMIVSNRVRSTCSSCPYCSGKRLLLGFNDLASQRPEISKLWSKVNTLSPQEVTVGSSFSALWVCDFCEFLWRAPVKNLTIRGKRCPACAGKVVHSPYNSFAAVYPHLLHTYSSANEKPAHLLLWSSRKSVLLESESCNHSWPVVPYEILRRPWLSVCALCYGNKSKLERLVHARLALLAPSALLHRNKRPLRGPQGEKWELDFWLPELKLAFEVQDLATHHRTSDQEPLPASWLEKQAKSSRKFSGLKKGPAYHEEKRRLALAQLGVTLIDLWEDEILGEALDTVVLAAIADASQARKGAVV